MVGRDPRNLFPPYDSHSTGALVLETKGFRAAGALDVDFELYRGEILGIGGLVGHGQEDFMMGLYGAVPAQAEAFRVFKNGAAVRSAPFAKVADANAVGVAYVPADRRKEGLLLPHSIDFNLLLPLFASHSGERRRGAQEAAITERLAQRPRHSRRPAAAGPGFVGRQPAESGAFEMAGARAVGPAPE